LTAVVVKLQGGLGNQMFQYAAGRAASIRRNAILYLDLHALFDRKPREGFTFRDYELHAFQIHQRFASSDGLEWSKCGLLDRVLMQLGGSPLSKPSRHVEALPGPLQNGVIEGQGHLLLDGLWQDHRYFADVESVIRKDFALWRPLQGRAAELREELVGSDAVCLHVRRTDFVADPVMGGIGLAYYRRAISLLTEHHGALPVYVFSDDLSWCREHLAFLPGVRFVTLDDAGGSIHNYQELMRHCKHFAIPNSTYSWWAAYLCDRVGKTVVAPREWYRGSGVQAQSVNVCPPSWVLI
jgi:Glycosyl transferase family 11